MPSNHDSGRAGQPGKRRVLRKIESASAKPGASAAAAGVTMRPPPRLSQPEPDEIPLPLQRPATPRPPAAAAIARPAEPLSPASTPPGGTYTSVPPVVATVITPLGTTLDPPAPTRRSTVRGVVVGACLGLTIVAAFVAGTRMALRAQAGTGPAAAAGMPAQTPPHAQPQTAAATPVQPPAAVSIGDGLPVVAASQLPLAPPVPKRGHRAWKPVAKGASQVEPAEGASTSGAVAPPAASAGAAAEPASDDTATSLVPVIPAATVAAPVDPFVKAVQTDIDEDNSKHR